jgi:hypothetical protein
LAEQAHHFLAQVSLPQTAVLAHQVSGQGSSDRFAPCSLLAPSAAGLRAAVGSGRAPVRRGGAREGGVDDGAGAAAVPVAASSVGAMCGRDWSEAAGLLGRVLARVGRGLEALSMRSEAQVKTMRYCLEGALAGPSEDSGPCSHGSGHLSTTVVYHHWDAHSRCLRQTHCPVYLLHSLLRALYRSSACARGLAATGLHLECDCAAL